MRNTGLQIHNGGVLKQVEIAGPANVHAWSKCCDLLTTALVGSGAVGLGPMLHYGRLITDTCEPIRRIDVSTSVSDGRKMPAGTHGAPSQGAGAKRRDCRITQPVSLATVRPTWDSVWSAAGDDIVYWHRQFEEKAW